jgi:hypothetical protein
MSPLARSCLKVVAVLLVFASLTFAASLLPCGGTPYGSALSSLGPSAALAAPGCSMQICEVPKGSKPASCLASTLNYNCSKSGGHCTSIAC